MWFLKKTSECILQNCFFYQLYTETETLVLMYNLEKSFHDKVLKQYGVDTSFPGNLI